MKKQSRLVGIFLVLLFFLFMHYFFGPSREPKNSPFLDRAVVFFLQPVVKVFNNTNQFFSDTFNQYFYLINTRQENIGLKKNIQLLKLQNRSLRELLSQKYNETKARQSYSFLNQQILRVNVLAYDPIPQSRTILIDAGLDQKIKINTILVSGEGLIGKVIQVFDKTSKVLLLIDSYFSVDAFNLRTGMRCLVKGISFGRLSVLRFPFLSQIEYAENGFEFKEGDQLFTSGVHGVYPRGISVGKLTDITMLDKGYFSKGAVLPSVDFAKMQNVYVLKNK